MELDGIAAEVGTTTTRQRERGVAAVDATDGSLADRLAPFAEDLPCTAAGAATVVESYAGGASVGEAAGAASVAPVTAAKALHLLGVEGLCPLSPVARGILTDWLAADLARSEALELTGASEAEFALATFLATHDPIEGARSALEGALENDGDVTVRKRDHLAETMSGVGDLL